MGGLSDAVKNGPAAKGADRARIQARIELAEQRAKTAERRAVEASRRAAKGNGPLAWYRRQEAEAAKTVAEQHRYTADQLRTKLAKAKADEATREAKRAKRLPASTAAAGLVPKPAGQVAQPDGQAGRARSKGGHMDDEATIRSRRSSAWNRMFPGSLTDSQRRFWTERDSGYTGWLDQDGHRAPDPFTTPTKGPDVTAGTGEAVNIEATRALLATLRSQAEETRSSIDGTSSSLASRGLTEFAGEFAAADDHLDGFLSVLDKADARLADQQGVQEAAQAAGEMADREFYQA